MTAIDMRKLDDNAMPAVATLPEAALKMPVQSLAAPRISDLLRGLASLFGRQVAS